MLSGTDGVSGMMHGRFLERTDFVGTISGWAQKYFLEGTEFVGTLSRLAHRCFVERTEFGGWHMDAFWNGRTLWGRYPGGLMHAF